MRNYWTPANPPSNKDRIWERYSRRRWDRVLELGPYDGRDTINLSRHAEHVTAIDGRPENITTVDNACESAGVYNADLHYLNLENSDFTDKRLGWFDCAWCVGVLYHLPNPWYLVKQLAGATNIVYGWSHLAERTDGERNGYHGRPYAEGGQADRLSGLSPESWWIMPEDFVRLWTEAGFHRFRWLTNPHAPHPNGGLAAQFTADKDT